MCDMAHPAGLIAKGLLSSPFEHCHIVTSTTHKTLRGPRGGIIMMKKDFENPFGQKDPKGNIKNDEQPAGYGSISWYTGRSAHAYHRFKSDCLW